MWCLWRLFVTKYPARANESPRLRDSLKNAAKICGGEGGIDRPRPAATLPPAQFRQRAALDSKT
jgi:hypothetical protein